MSIDYNLIETRVDPRCIAENLGLVSRGRPAWPVIKADAYGHGIEQAAAALAEAGYKTMCAGTIEESARLAELGVAERVISLLGPIEGRDFDLAAKSDVVSFVYEAAQIKALSIKGLKSGKRLPICIKFDTGMSRLGFDPGNLRGLMDVLALSPGINVAAAASHLSSADMPAERDFTLAQADKFRVALDALDKAGYAAPEATLANSAASLAYPDMAFDALRPGIAIYGANPFYGTEMAHLGEGLKPAMQVKSKIVSVKDLPAGSSISYGRTYKAESDMRAAVVAAGYADAYSRGLSGKGEIVVRARRAKILGRVCMQLIVVDVTNIPEAKPGDDAWLLGGPGLEPVSPEELAAWWGTITYEVFCMLGMNKRVYLP